jgi:hypothetical protein
MLLSYARSIVLAVKHCSNGIFGHVRRYGKSPCFSRLVFLNSADIGYRGKILTFSPWRVFHG